MARPLKQIFTCPICKDEFTREAWPFTRYMRHGVMKPRPKYTCTPCRPEYDRQIEGRKHRAANI